MFNRSFRFILFILLFYHSPFCNTAPINSTRSDDKPVPDQTAPQTIPSKLPSSSSEVETTKIEESRFEISPKSLNSATTESTNRASKTPLSPKSRSKPDTSTKIPETESQENNNATLDLETLHSSSITDRPTNTYHHEEAASTEGTQTLNGTIYKGSVNASTSTYQTEILSTNSRGGNTATSRKSDYQTTFVSENDRETLPIVTEFVSADPGKITSEVAENSVKTETIMKESISKRSASTYPPPEKTTSRGESTLTLENKGTPSKSESTQSTDRDFENTEDSSSKATPPETTLSDTTTQKPPSSSVPVASPSTEDNFYFTETTASPPTEATTTQQKIATTTTAYEEDNQMDHKDLMKKLEQIELALNQHDKETPKTFGSSCKTERQSYGSFKEKMETIQARLEKLEADSLEYAAHSKGEKKAGKEMTDLELVFTKIFDRLDLLEGTKSKEKLVNEVQDQSCWKYNKGANSCDTSDEGVDGKPAGVCARFKKNLPGVIADFAKNLLSDVCVDQNIVIAVSGGD